MCAIGSMTVRTDNAVKYKCHTFGSATHTIVTRSMTVRIGNAAKNKCNMFSSAVHITTELYICTCFSKECIEIMRVMVVTWLVNVGLSVSV